METQSPESTFLNEFHSPKSNGALDKTALSNNNNDNDDHKAVAAANLIKTLDTALSEMSNLSTNAARNVEDARRTAREASEVARRYTARSYQSSTTTNRHAPNGIASTTTRTTKEQNHHVEDLQKRHESSSERLARSHAQDVLALSLELERTKQALQQECMAHDATRSTLSQARAQQTIVTTQLEQAQQQHASQLLKKEETISILQQDVQTAQEAKKAAEEDAQLALELAMGNAESREQLESWLERALQEVQVLRGQLTSHYALYPTTTTTILATTSSTTEPTTQPQQQQQEEYSGKDESTTRRSVRFAESPTVLNDHDQQEDNDTPSSTTTTSPRRLVASRSMVAAGRHLLHRATDNENHGDEISTAQRLRQRLLAINNNNDKTNDAKQEHAMVVSSNNANCAMSSTSSNNIIGLLQSCATRLGIQVTIGPNNNHGNDHDQVEDVTRQFCKAVESKLNHEKQDVQELQALCEFLENKLLVGKDDEGS